MTTNLGVHRHINRDINGGLNIQECLYEWIHNKKRPESLERVDLSFNDKSAQMHPQEIGNQCIDRI